MPFGPARRGQGNGNANHKSAQRTLRASDVETRLDTRACPKTAACRRHGCGQTSTAAAPQTRPAWWIPRCHPRPNRFRRHGILPARSTLDAKNAIPILAHPADIVPSAPCAAEFHVGVGESVVAANGGRMVSRAKHAAFAPCCRPWPAFATCANSRVQARSDGQARSGPAVPACGHRQHRHSESANPAADARASIINGGYPHRAVDTV